MKPGWLIGLVMLFVVFQIIANVCELLAPLSASAVSTLQTLLQPSFPEFKVALVSFIPSISVQWVWMESLWKAYWFDYPFFAGAWLIVRYLLFMPVSVGVIVSLVLAVVRGV